MKKRGEAMYNPQTRIRNPKTVAELSDANALRGLAAALDTNMDALTTAGARSGVMNARQILIGAAAALASSTH